MYIAFVCSLYCFCMVLDFLGLFFMRHLTHYHTCITLPRWGQGESWRLCLGRWRWGGGVPRWRFGFSGWTCFVDVDIAFLLRHVATYLGILPFSWTTNCLNNRTNESKPFQELNRIEGLCMSRWNFQVAQYVIWHVYCVFICSVWPLFLAGFVSRIAPS